MIVLPDKTPKWQSWFHLKLVQKDGLQDLNLGYVNLLYCLWNMKITFGSCDRQSQRLGSREVTTLANNQFTDQSSQLTLTLTNCKRN